MQLTNLRIDGGILVGTQLFLESEDSIFGRTGPVPPNIAAGGTGVRSPVNQASCKSSYSTKNNMASNIIKHSSWQKIKIYDKKNCCQALKKCKIKRAKCDNLLRINKNNEKYSGVPII